MLDRPFRTDVNSLPGRPLRLPLLTVFHLENLNFIKGRRAAMEFLTETHKVSSPAASSLRGSGQKRLTAGGHFAPSEEPDQLVADLRAFYRSFR